MKDPVAEYVRWLTSQIRSKEAGGWNELTLPFLDRNNDMLQLYVRQNKDVWEITDDGSIITGLSQSGFSFTDKRAEIVATILRGFNLKMTADEHLTIKAREEEFARAMHKAIQAALAIDNLGYVSEANVKSMFEEDVGLWLDTNKVRYVRDYTVTGKSGMSVKFPFVIPASASSPQKYIQLLNNPSHANLKLRLFEWADTEAIWNQKKNAISIVNDDGFDIPNKLSNALASYDVSWVRWSERENAKKLFVA